MVIGLDEKFVCSFEGTVKYKVWEKESEWSGSFFCWQDENKQKNEKNMKEA